MFEGLVAGLLNQYLGAFIQGLNEKQLKISVLGGEVNLTNLQLQPTCLDFLNLPVAVKQGTLGRLYLKANWAKLGSTPVQIILEKISLVATKKDKLMVDEEKEKEKISTARATQLEQWETSQLATEENKKSEVAEKSEESNSSFSSRLAAKIIANVQISIRDIDIMYADTNSKGEPVMLGLHLGELTGLTVDSQGRPAFVTDVQQYYKQVALKDFYIFLNAGSGKSKQMDYLLRPLESSVQVVVNNVNDFSVPFAIAKLVIPSLQLALSQPQYHAVLDITNNLSKAQATLTSQIVAVHHKIAPRTLTQQERDQYTQLYSRSLNAVGTAELSAKEVLAKEAMEKDLALDVSDLIVCRTMAFASVRKMLKGKPVTLRDKKKKHWWSRSSKETKQGEIPEISEKEMEQLYAEIQYNPKEEKQAPPKFVQADITVVIEKMGVALMGPNATIVELALLTTQVGVKKYEQGLGVNLKLESIVAIDHRPNTAFPRIISPEQDAKALPGASAKESVAEFSVEITPQGQSQDLRVSGKMRNQTVIVHQELFTVFSTFFTAPVTVDSLVVELASDSVESIKRATAESLVSQAKNHPTITINLELKAPTILLPRNSRDAKSDMLVIDLGSIIIKGRPQSAEARAEGYAQIESLAGQVSLPREKLALVRVDKCYDGFTIALKSAEVYLSEAATDSRSAKSRHVAQLLAPFDVTFDLGLTTAPSVLWLPKLKLRGELPSVALSISLDSYGRLMGVLGSFITTTPAQNANSAPSLQQSAAKALLQPTNEQEEAEANTPATVTDVVDLMGKQGSDETWARIKQEFKFGVVTRKELRMWVRRNENAEYRKAQYDSLLDASFSVSSLSVDIRTVEGKSSNQEFVTRAVLEGFGLTAGKVGYVLNVNMALRSLLVSTTFRGEAMDIVTTTAPGGKLPVLLAPSPVSSPSVSSPSSLEPGNAPSNSFITLDYTARSEAAVSFETDPVLADVSLRMGSVLVNVQPRVIERLMSFLMDELIPVLEQSIPKPSPNPINNAGSLPSPNPSPAIRPANTPTQPASLQRQLSKAIVVKREKEGPVKRDVFVKMRVKATMEAVQVSLLFDNAAFARLQVQEVVFGLMAYPLSNSVAIDLSSLSLHSLAQNAPVRSIVYTRQQQQPSSEKSSTDRLVSIRFNTFNEKEQGWKGVPAVLSAKISGLRLTFINQFVLDAVAYFTTGPFGRIMAARAAAPPPIQNSAGSPPPAASPSSPAAPPAFDPMTSFVSMELDLMDVILTAPVTATKKECDAIFARLDTISVRNSLETGGASIKGGAPNSPAALIAGSGEKYQRFRVALSAFTISTLQQLPNERQRSTYELFVLESTTLYADLVPQKQVLVAELSLPTVSATVSRSQYTCLMDLLAGNLGDQPTIMFPQEAAPPPPYATAVGGSSSPSRPRPLSVSIPQEQPPSPFQVRFMLRINEVALLLKEGTGTAPKSELIRAAIKGVDMDLGINAGDMSLFITLAALSLNDLSESGRIVNNKEVLTPYREMIAFRESANPKDAMQRPLVVQLNRSGKTLATVIDVRLQSFRFSVAGVLLKLGQYLSYQSPYFRPPTVPMVDDGFTPVSTERPLGPPASPGAPGGVQPSVDLTFTSDGVTVVLASDPTSKKTSGLVVELAMGMQMRSRGPSIKMSGGLTNVMLAHHFFVIENDEYIFQKEHTERVTVAPVAINFNIDMTTPPAVVDLRSFPPPPPPQPFILCHMQLIPTKMDITYRAYITAMRAFQVMMMAVANPPADGGASQPGSGKEPLSGKEEAVSSSPASPSSGGLLEPIGANAPGAPGPAGTVWRTAVKLYPTLIFELTVPTLSVCLFDDASASRLPLLRARLDAVLITANALSNGLSADVRANAAVDAFDSSQVQWQSLVEPVSLQLHLDQISSRWLIEPQTSIDVSLLTPLNVNFTSGLATTAFEALDLLQRADKDCTAPPRPVGTLGSRYRLKNQLEFPLRVSLDQKNDKILTTDSKKNLAEKSFFMVEPGSEVPFDFRESEEWTSHAIAVEMTRDGATSTPMEVAVSKVGVAKRTVTGFTRDAVEVVFDIINVAGIKWVSVHSTLGLSNETGHSIVTSMQPGGARLKLEPGETGWAPVALVNEIRELRCAATTDGGSTAANEDPVTFRYPVVSASSAPLQLRSENKQLQFAFTLLPPKPAVSGVFAKYSLRAAVMFENQLTCDLDVRCAVNLTGGDSNLGASPNKAGAGAGAGANAVMLCPAGSFTPLHTEQGAFISFRVANLPQCQWSAPLPLIPGKFPDDRKAVIRAPDPMFFCVNWQQEDPGCVSVTLFSYCCFVDLTDLGLRMSWNKRDTNSQLRLQSKGDAVLYLTTPEKDPSLFVQRKKAGPDLWSDAIMVDSLVSEPGIQVVPGPNGNCEVAVRVGERGRSKLLTFAPRYVLCNKLDITIILRDPTGTQPNIELKPGDRNKFTWIDSSDEHQERPKVKLPEGRFLWVVTPEGQSGCFPIDQPGRVRMRMGSPQSGFSFLQIDIIPQEATLFVVLARPEKALEWFVPFRLQNNSQGPIQYRQQQTCFDAKERPWSTIERNGSALYAWEQPSAPDTRLEVRVADRAVQVVDLATPITLDLSRNKEPLFLRVDSVHSFNLLTVTNSTEKVPGSNETLLSSRRRLLDISQDQQQLANVVSLALHAIPGSHALPLNPNTRLVLVVECPNTKEKMSIVAYDGTQADRVLEENKRLLVARAHRLMISFPPQIWQGTDLLSSKLYRDLRANFRFRQGESVLYLASNGGPGIAEDDISYCVFATDQRFAVLKKGCTSLEFELADLVAVNRVKASQVRWDRIDIHLRTKHVNVGIWNAKVAKFFARFLVGCVSQASAAIAHWNAVAPPPSPSSSGSTRRLSRKGSGKKIAKPTNPAEGPDDADLIESPSKEAQFVDASHTVSEFLHDPMHKILHFHIPSSVFSRTDAQLNVSLELQTFPSRRGEPKSPEEKGTGLSSPMAASGPSCTVLGAAIIPIHSLTPESRFQRVDLSPPKSASAPPLSLLLSLCSINAPPLEERAILKTSLSLISVGLSLVDELLELLYISVHGIQVSLEQSLDQMLVKGKIEHFQVDNQHFGSKYPVVLTPTPVSASELRPLVEFSMNKLELGNAGINIINYATILIQSIDVKAEELLVWQTVEFFQKVLEKKVIVAASRSQPLASVAAAASSADPISAALDDKQVSQGTVDIPDCTQLVRYTDSEDTYFFRYLQIQPIVLNVIFEAYPGVRRQGSSRQPWVYTVRGLVAMLGSIDATLKFNCLTVKECVGTVDVLLNPIQAHYRSQASKQVGRLVGSVQILGSPANLVGHLGRGLADFFYEPRMGIVKSPEAFGKGLLKGSISLLDNTFAGVFGTVSKITGSVGKGAALLSMDDQFIDKHNQTKRAPHAAAGLKSGLTTLGTGLVQGVTGVVTQPIQGAISGSSKGVGGTMKGLAIGFGKGLVGVVAKPVVGVAGFATQTLDGIGNTPNYFRHKNVQNYPVRLQRYIDPSAELNPYNEVEARRQFAERVARHDRGHGATESNLPEGMLTADALRKSKSESAFVAKLGLPAEEHVLFFARDTTSDCTLLTDKRILKVKNNQIEQQVDLSSIAVVKLVDRGTLRWHQLVCTQSNGNQSSIGIFSGQQCAFFLRQIQERITSGSRETYVKLQAQTDQKIKSLSCPSIVRTGKDVGRIQADLASKRILGDGENIVYQVTSNPNNPTASDTQNCSVITNQRVFRIENGKVIQEVNIADLHHCQHFQGGKLRWDAVQITRKDGSVGSVGVWHSAACKFFVGYLNIITEEAAQATALAAAAPPS